MASDADAFRGSAAYWIATSASCILKLHPAECADVYSTWRHS